MEEDHNKVQYISHKNYAHKQNKDIKGNKGNKDFKKQNKKPLQYSHIYIENIDPFV